MNTRSIRFRLTVWYALVLTAGLGLFCMLVLIFMGHQLMAELDSELNGRASRLETYFKDEAAKTTTAQLHDELEEFAQAFGPGSYVQVKGSQSFLFRYPPRAISEGRILQRKFSLDQQEYELEVGIPTTDKDRTMAVLRSLLLGLIPVVILISSIGGGLLSRRALRPVTDLTEAAQSISIENLSERLPVANTGDELARLAATLNTMLARLEGAVTTLSQFVADASHEFRTPLAIIQTTVELALRRPRSTGEYRQSLEQTADEVARMTHLVEDLLTLARTDTGAVDMPRSTVDLRALLEDVLNETRALADLRQVRIIQLAAVNDHPERPALISGNRTALHRLLLVLIDNALKYSKPGGKVTASVEQYESSVAVVIHDSGVGISAEHLPHIFKRFYRGDPARTQTGHGLGLALAQSIVRAHNANIGVSSTPGISTEFRVEFAARTAPVEPVATTAPTPAA